MRIAASLRGVAESPVTALGAVGGAATKRNETVTDLVFLFLTLTLLVVDEGMAVPPLAGTGLVANL